MNGVPSLLLALPPKDGRVAAFLRDRGYRIRLAANGADALRLALMEPPDVILYHEDCGVLSTEAFSRIVRSNVRLAQIPILTVGPDPAAYSLEAPLHPEKALLAVEAALAHRDGRPGSVGAEITSGVLGPLTVVDLLQPLRLQRRSGRLILRSPAGQGVIWLGEGEIVDAQLGAFWGKKALFRLFGCTEGTFELHPVGKEPARRIFEPFDFLVLEAARQKDELSVLLAQFPEGKRLTAAVDPRSVPAKPSLAWLLERLWGDALTVTEILDSLHLPDLDVAAALLSALRVGWVQVAPGGHAETGPWIAPEARRLLMRRLGGDGARVSGKIALVSDDPELYGRMLRTLARNARVRRYPRNEWGTLGTLDLGEGVVLDLVALPLGEEMAPLALFLSRGALGFARIGSAKSWSWLCASGPSVDVLPSDPVPGLRSLLESLAFAP